jgi:uncharacterized protein YggE
MASNSVKITGMIVGAVIVLALIGAFIAMQANPASGKTINVQGQSTIKVSPDLVTVYFTVQTTEKTAQGAKDKNAEVVDAAVTNLVKLGLERKDIVTENFNIYPQYDYKNSRSDIIGYQATHSLKVQLPINDSDKIGPVIDAGVNAGALISYINFELSPDKQNELKAQALKQATEDARIKAEAIASGLGKSLGKVVSISDNSFDYYPWPLYSNMDMSVGAVEAKSATTNIQPGDQTVSAQVSVSYRI